MIWVPMPPAKTTTGTLLGLGFKNVKKLELNFKISKEGTAGLINMKCLNRRRLSIFYSIIITWRRCGPPWCQFRSNISKKQPATRTIQMT